MIADLVQLYVSRGVDLPEIIQNAVDEGSITNLEEIIAEKKDIIDYTPFEIEEIVSNIKIVRIKNIPIRIGKITKPEVIKNDYLNAAKDLLEQLLKNQKNKITVTGNTKTIKNFFDGFTLNISKNVDEVPFIEGIGEITVELEKPLAGPTIVANLLEETNLNKNSRLYFLDNIRFTSENFKIPSSWPLFRKDPTSEDLLTTKKVAETINTLSFTAEEKNTSITILSKLAKLPDFMTNKYTAVLLPFSKNYDSETLSLLSEFCIRLEGIEIPLAKRASFETKFLNTSIKRLEPIVETKRSGSLTLRLDEKGKLEKLIRAYSDQKTFYPKLYNNLRKDNPDACNGVILETPDISENIASVNKELNSGALKGISELDWTLFVAQPIYTIDNMVDYFVNSKNQVKVPPYISGIPKETILPEVSPDELLKSKGEPPKLKCNTFIFENVRFLGQTQTLQYKADGANALNGSFKFIFRKVTTSQIPEVSSSVNL